MKLLRRILYLWNRRSVERDLADEMSAHREMLPEDRRASFGSPLKLREESRDAWGWTWLDQLRQDFAYGARQLRRSPGFTLMAVAILSIGVGLNLAVFHAVTSVVYSQITVRDATSLVRIVPQTPSRKLFAFPSAIAASYRESANLFAYVVTENAGWQPISLDDDPGTVRAGFVSSNYFADLGIVPVRGRLPGEADESEVPPSIAIGYGYWQRHFAGDPEILSRVVLVNGKPARVVGVPPAGFDGLAANRADVWLLQGSKRYFTNDSQPLTEYLRADTVLIGKLKPNVSLASASAQLAGLTAQLRAAHPDSFEEKETVLAQPFGNDELRLGPYSVLIPLSLLVLLSSCANLGNLLLARGLARGREIDTRIALGAGRWRVVRQLMAENFLLAALGAFAGLFVGRLGSQGLTAAFATAPAVRVIVDLPAILAAAALAIVSAIAFGLAPALRATSSRRQTNRARHILMGLQVAASCVLMIDASLVVRGSQRLIAAGARMDFKGVVVVEPGEFPAELAGPAKRFLFDDVASKFAALPGVESAAAAVGYPVFDVRAQSVPGMPTVFSQTVSPAYFGVMHLALVRGRIFDPAESGAAVLSESAARSRWPNEDPLGKTWAPPDATSGPTVVGVVADSPTVALRTANAVEIYLPFPRDLPYDSVILLRATSDSSATMKRARVIATAAGLTPYFSLLESQVNRNIINHSRSATQLFEVLGMAASVLAAIAIFGVVAFAVAERSREIGIRLALGARALHILRALFAQYTLPLALGAAGGLALAVIGEKLFNNRYPLGLIGFDPLAYAGGFAAFALIVAAAVLIPTRRALRIDPVSTLRKE